MTGRLGNLQRAGRCRRLDAKPSVSHFGRGPDAPSPSPALEQPAQPGGDPDPERTAGRFGGDPYQEGFRLLDSGRLVPLLRDLGSDLTHVLNCDVVTTVDH